jgi:hypothetical protein
MPHLTFIMIAGYQKGPKSWACQKAPSMDRQKAVMVDQ